MSAYRLIRTTAIVLAVSGIAIADDKPVKPERVTYRVLGLFSPDRDKDLRAAFEDIPAVKLIDIGFDDAEITVEFVPAKAFPGAKPELVIEQFDQKLRSASRHTFGVKPRRTIARDKLVQIVIPVAGLDCKACSLAAYESIATIDGVEQAAVSFKDGRVTARIDPEKTDLARLEEALRKKEVQVGKPKP